MACTGQCCAHIVQPVQFSRTRYFIKAVHFPENATLASVDPSSVRNLGLGTALGGIFFGVVTYHFYSRFNLSHERHAEIVAELTRRRAAQAPVAHADPLSAVAAYASVTE